MESEHDKGIDAPCLKKCFPFRVGTTSYIIPDEVVPNIKALARHVDDIELVLFESDEISNLPDARTIEILTDLSREHDLTYTIHFPLDTQLGALCEKERRRSVEKCLRVYDITHPLNPPAWILHFHGEKRGREPASDISAWTEQLAKSANELTSRGVPAEKIAVETLDYPFELVFPIVDQFGLSVCVDVGHLIVNGVDPLTTLKRYGDRCKVIHLHGVRDGKDHTDLESFASEFLIDLKGALPSPLPDRFVVTLEVFDKRIFELSTRVLRKLWM